MTSHPSPTDLQLDALREVANVGAGHAARALSALVGGQKMGMDIPRAQRVEAPELAEMLGGAGASVVCVSFQMTGALAGQILLVWTEPDAQVLAEWLLKSGGPSNAKGSVSSALAEAANIIASACLSAVGQLAGIKLLPSVPHLQRSNAEDVARQALLPLSQSASASAAGWVLEARLFSAELSSRLLLVPDPHSMAFLLAKLRV